MSTPLIKPHIFDKQNAIFGCKTDTNITVMSTISLKQSLNCQQALVLFAPLIVIGYKHQKLNHSKYLLFWRSGSGLQTRELWKSSILYYTIYYTSVDTT